MSRAFVKEDGPEPDEDPAERPVSGQPNYVTRRGLKALEDWEARLVAELKTLSGAQEDAERRKRKRILERDLRYCRARLDAALPVDAAPKDEVRFGARVTLRRDDGTERVLRIVGEDEAEEGGEAVAWTGPFVQALFGLKTGAALDWETESGPERWTVVAVAYAG
ncbi:MAG: GreA/GreB family elongation factor [Elusimicrobia bacterium]|nr:GreA/GreB family elongation factor [Elusimicrobiota bacterium]